MAIAEELRRTWRLRLQEGNPSLSPTDQESIIDWLLGEDTQRFDDLEPSQLAIAKQAMDYRYRILQQRYLGVPQERAYRQLIQRLSSLFLIRNKIKAWVALSRDRQRTVMDVLQEVIQELMQSDKYMRQQMSWIAQCVSNQRLRNSILLTSIEEYCLRPIRNQPLLVYRFVNYLRRSQRGGMTQVPTGDLIRLVSDEISSDDADNPVSLLDAQAKAVYEDSQAWEEQQSLREKVVQEFIAYLADNVEPLAAEWLRLHLQGHSQETIAQMLDLPIKTVYRLREKISYHAIRVFAFKHQPELVGGWLGTTLAEHGLGLTPEQWKILDERMTPVQRQVLSLMKEGQSIEAIATLLNLKTSQVLSEWSKIYLIAQSLRGDE
jgi:DNA-binding CsgD family transcriptional regulator